MPGPGSVGGERKACIESSDLHETAPLKLNSGLDRARKSISSSFLSLLLPFTHSAKFRNLKSLLPERESERVREKNDILKPYAYLKKKKVAKHKIAHPICDFFFSDACFTIPSLLRGVGAGGVVHIATQ